VGVGQREISHRSMKFPFHGKEEEEYKMQLMLQVAGLPFSL
jgi:hypothetical protein